MSSSWKDESSHTTSRPGSTWPSSSVSARPTFPATGAPSMNPTHSAVVVFPFVPVTPRIGLRNKR